MNFLPPGPVMGYPEPEPLGAAGLVPVALVLALAAADVASTGLEVDADADVVGTLMPVSIELVATPDAERENVDVVELGRLDRVFVFEGRVQLGLVL